MSTIFQVNKVNQEEIKLKPKTLNDIFKCKSDNHKDLKIEAISNYDNLYGCNMHGLFYALVYSYSYHHSIELEPDHFKLLILQGLATHINLNSEKLRDEFVNHKDTKTINIRRNDFILDGKNPWYELFDDFAEKIKLELKDEKLVNLIQKRLTTSTDNSIASFNIALMDSMQKYFNYSFSTLCGFPYINLKGTVQDWTDILELIDYISKYDLSWWTQEIKQVINQFVDTIKNGILNNISFWYDMINMGGGSGGPYYNGWICKFFPYINERRQLVKNIFNYKNNYGGGISGDSIPSGISTVPVVWNYYEQEIKLKFASGFFGFTTVKNNDIVFIKPEFSWVVYENKD